MNCEDQDIWNFYQIYDLEKQKIEQEKEMNGTIKQIWVYLAEKRNELKS